MSITINPITVTLASITAPVQSDPVPSAEPQLPGDLSAKMSTVLGVAQGIGLVVCAIAIIVSAAQWAIATNRGQGSEGISGVAKAAMAAVLITLAISIINFFV